MRAALVREAARDGLPRRVKAGASFPGAIRGSRIFHQVAKEEECRLQAGGKVNSGLKVSPISRPAVREESLWVVPVREVGLVAVVNKVALRGEDREVGREEGKEILVRGKISHFSRNRVRVKAGSTNNTSGRLLVVERAEVLGVSNLLLKLVDLEDPAAGLPRRQAGSNRLLRLLRLRAARVVELRPHRLPRRCPSRRFWESSLHRF